MATLCGHGLDPLFEAANRAGMRLIDTRNEQTAAYIADAYGRLTGQPGICAVSSGIAMVNALTGVANAWFDRSPMLLLSGAAAAATAGMGHFQDLDQVGLARSITKFSRSIDTAERTLQILHQALEVATAAAPGPVHLMFPMDIQNAEVPASGVVPLCRLGPESCFSPGDVHGLAAALAGAQAPLVVAGSGVFYSHSGDALLPFCKEARIPVVTPIWDRGSVDQASPVFCGVVGAASGGPNLLGEADCIVMAGAEADYRVGYLLPPTVRKDARVVAFSGPWDALAAACRSQDGRAREVWLDECVRRRNAFRAAAEHRAREQAGDGMHALHVLEAIRSVAALDPVMLLDGGSIGQWAHQLLCSDRYPGHWLTCGRSGVVGWGIGGAMGARLAFPERPVILLSGDGAFTFNVADLESAARQKLPFVAIVADDLGWGITRTGHVRQFGTPIASSLGPVAFDRLAEALGARGVIATTPDAIAQELRKAIAEPAVTVIHVPIVGGNP